MLTFEQVISTGLSLNIWGVVKVFYLAIIVLFLLFALIVIRQVQLMTHTLNGNLNLPLKTLSYINLAVVLAVFLFALVVL